MIPQCEYTQDEVLSIQRFSGSVLAEIVQRQPPSAARTSFAWQLAVGPALARVTTVTNEGSTIVVQADDARWTPEIARARDIILARLQQFLGADEVTRIRIDTTR